MAYSAYLDHLQSNIDSIEAFNWSGTQLRENNSIAFVDLTGDETPEMVYLYAQTYKKSPVGNHNHGRAQLRVITFSDGGVKTAFETTDEFGLYQNEAGGEMDYAVFTKQGEKALYYYTRGANEAGTRTLVRITFDDSLNSETETLSRVNSTDSPPATAEEAEIMSNFDKVISRTISMSYFDGIPEGSGMTYSEAAAYLQGLSGGSGSNATAAAQSDIFSEMGGKTYLSKGRGYSAASFKVNSDGSFTFVHNSGNTPSESEAGSFSSPEQISDICYKCVITCDNSSINGKAAYIYTPDASLDALPDDAANALIDHIFIGFGNRSRAEQKLGNPIGKYFIVVENDGIAYIDNEM